MGRWRWFELIQRHTRERTSDVKLPSCRSICPARPAGSHWPAQWGTWLEARCRTPSPIAWTGAIWNAKKWTLSSSSSSRPNLSKLVKRNEGSRTTSAGEHRWLLCVRARTLKQERERVLLIFLQLLTSSTPETSNCQLIYIDVLYTYCWLRPPVQHITRYRVFAPSYRVNCAQQSPHPYIEINELCKVVYKVFRTFTGRQTRSIRLWLTLIELKPWVRPELYQLQVVIGKQCKILVM